MDSVDDVPFTPSIKDLFSLNDLRNANGLSLILPHQVSTVGEWRKFCEECDAAAEAQDEAEEEAQDDRGPAIVVEGSIVRGFKHYGPFESIDKAVEWHKSTSPFPSPVHVVLLKEPIEVTQ